MPTAATGEPADSHERLAASGLVEHFFRRRYARLVAVLTRRVGVRHVDLVEDAVQSALMTALSTWVDKGTPDDPDAWLFHVARNHLIGAIRQASGRKRILETSAPDLASAAANASLPESDGAVREELLRMLFVCCDDAIPRDSRLVLALKTLCGFSTTEIARRLFLSEVNVHKRLGRARERLREFPPEFDALPLASLEPRLSSVHGVLYLLFNEGYLSAQPDRAIRRELCDEAIELATLLAEHPVTATPETFALLALMHLHCARIPARLDAMGGLMLLNAQDRTLWDQQQLRLGAEWLKKSASGGTFTRFHAEAGIAAEHAFAPTFAETRWHEIVDLYVMLDGLAPSPLNTLNRAVAVAEWQGPEAGLAILRTTEPPPWMLGYHLWDSVLGELHRRAGHDDEARHFLERAFAMAPTDAERELLRQRLATLGGR